MANRGRPPDSGVEGATSLPGASANHEESGSGGERRHAVCVFCGARKGNDPGFVALANQGRQPALVDGPGIFDRHHRIERRHDGPLDR